VFDKLRNHFRQQACILNTRRHDAGAGRRDDLIPPISALIRRGGRAFDLPCLEQIERRGRRPDRDLCESSTTSRAPTTHHFPPPFRRTGSDAARDRQGGDDFDTMTDRRIGIPSVIEKFAGDHREKVRRRAGAGRQNSTTMSSACPGGGVSASRPHAQLIVEGGYAICAELVYSSALRG